MVRGLTTGGTDYGARKASAAQPSPAQPSPGPPQQIRSESTVPSGEPRRERTERPEGGGEVISYSLWGERALQQCSECSECSECSDDDAPDVDAQQARKHSQASSKSSQHRAASYVTYQLVVAVVE